MGTILCAARGGEESYRTIDKAIALAKERGDTLFFLCVVDLHFLDKTAAPIMVDVEEELTQMGEFLLLMAEQRAAEQGVNAETICRKGSVREIIKRAAIEIDSALVILGRPSGEESKYSMADLETFAAEIEAETGAKTKIV